MSRRRLSQRELFESGYVQEWIWSYSGAKKLVRYVLLAIGRWARRRPSGEYETRPLSVDELKDSTDLGESTIYKAIEELSGPLGELDVIRTAQPGNVRRFRLRRQLSLLMDVDEPTRHRSRVRESPVPRTGDSGTAYGSEPYGVPVPPVPGTGDVSAEAMSSEGVRTEVPTTSLEEQAAEGFLDWFAETFRQKRRCVYSVKRGLALAAIRQMLAERDLPTLDARVRRLQVMALWMFAAERDRWIISSDYSIFVLQHKATYLEGVVVANDDRGPDELLSEALG